MLGLLCGCSDEDPAWSFPGQRVWESEHFRYHSYENDDTICEGVVDHLEQHFARAQEYLGFPWCARAAWMMRLCADRLMVFAGAGGGRMT